AGFQNRVSLPNSRSSFVFEERCNHLDGYSDSIRKRKSNTPMALAGNTHHLIGVGRNVGLENAGVRRRRIDLEVKAVRVAGRDLIDEFDVDERVEALRVGAVAAQEDYVLRPDRK